MSHIDHTDGLQGLERLAHRWGADRKFNAISAMEGSRSTGT
ncbi:MAG: hypothetical protein ABJB66_13020 [Gemmatimonadaceae bacterium]